MTDIEELLCLARIYAEAERLELSTVSSRIFDDGKKLPAIAQGADISTRRREKAIKWFSSHWPDNAIWPSGVPRPVSTPTPQGTESAEVGS